MGFTPLTDEEREVYTGIARRLGGPDFDPGLLFPLQMAMNLDQAKVYLEMPGPSEDIAKKLGFTTDFVEDTCKELYHKGYVVLTRKAGWQPARSIIQVTDTGPIQKYADELGDNYFAALTGGMGPITSFAMMAMPIPLLKVVPHPQALQKSGFKKKDILPIEDIRELYKKASSIAAHYCCCRRAVFGAEEREDAYVCMAFDYMAEYQVKRGSAKMMSYEEALEWEKKCMKTWNAITPANGTYLDAFCNCNYEVPCVWEIMESKGKPMKDGVAPSRYQAIADPAKCISCQECVTKCKADACKMIQYPGERKYKAWIDPDKCMGCGCCVTNCKGKACTLICVRPPEFINTEDRPEAGRYDKPEKYLELAGHTAVAKEAYREKVAEMEKEWCLKHGINRDPYRSRMEFEQASFQQSHFG
ncbi:ATP-binding protein [Thermodesulfobacteriota bacterium]